MNLARLQHNFTLYSRAVRGKMGKNKGKNTKAIIAATSKSDKEKSEDTAATAISMNKNGEIMLRIHAKPNAKTTRVIAVGTNEIDLAIAAPPRDGQANETLIDAMKAFLGLRKDEITFDAGARSRSKILLISSGRITVDEVRKKLEKNAAEK